MGKSEKVAILSICLNLFLFFLKYIISIISGSIAIKAEAFHSLTDLVASFAVWGVSVFSVNHYWSRE